MYDDDNMDIEPTMSPRRKNNGLIQVSWFFAICLAFAILAILSHTIFFNTKNIVIEGSSIYSAEEILEASGIESGDNLMSMKANKIEKKILSSLAYIETATIKKKFPSTISITVTPSEAAANFIYDDNILLISKGGKILDALDDAKSGLITFIGTEPNDNAYVGETFESADSSKTTVIYKLLDALIDSEYEDINSVDVSSTTEIKLYYQDRITIEIGNINDIDYKLSFTYEIVTTKLGDTVEGTLSILTDKTQASFMDKATLENNDEIYNQNIETRNTTAEEDEEDDEEDDDDSSSSVAVME